MFGPVRSTLIAAAAALPFVGPAPAALAATAHNSQAGAWGPNSHTCAPTPYFERGGCLDSALTEGFGGDAPLPPPGRYRESPPPRMPER